MELTTNSFYETVNWVKKINLDHTITKSRYASLNCLMKEVLLSWHLGWDQAVQPAQCLTTQSKACLLKSKPHCAQPGLLLRKCVLFCLVLRKRASHLSLHLPLSQMNSEILSEFSFFIIIIIITIIIIIVLLPNEDFCLP